MSPDMFDDFIATQLDKYYSRLLARAYMQASGSRKTSEPLKGEELASAFSIATTRLLADAELSFQEFIAVFDTMIRNVASRRNQEAVSAHLETIMPQEPDIIFPDLIPSIPLPMQQQQQQQE